MVLMVLMLLLAFVDGTVGVQNRGKAPAKTQAQQGARTPNTAPRPFLLQAAHATGGASKQAHLAKERRVRRHALHRAADLVKVLRRRELVVAVRVQQAEPRVELLAVVARELGADRVERDVERAAVGLEREEVGHDVGGRAAEQRAVGGEVVEVGLVAVL